VNYSATRAQNVKRYTARYSGTCAICGARWPAGASIVLWSQVGIDAVERGTRFGCTLERAYAHAECAAPSLARELVQHTCSCGAPYRMGKSRVDRGQCAECFYRANGYSERY
jgi:hypothetical protein